MTKLEDIRLTKYGNFALLDAATDVYTAHGHTMKAHFRDYIGRRGVETKIEMQPEFKKFTRVQCDMLISAYINGINIRIISCWRKDVAELAQRNAFNIETIGDVFERTGKEFNKFRQQFFNVSSHIDSKQELWIAVFPSSEYVDQIAELVQAIVQDFPIPNNSSGWTRPTVFTVNTPTSALPFLEKWRVLGRHGKGNGFCSKSRCSGVSRYR